MSINRATSRKFLLSCAVLLASVGFMAAGMLTGAQWVAIAGIIVGAYNAGNVLEGRG